MKRMSTLKAAKRYAKEGLSVIALKPNEKTPAIRKVTPYMHRLPTKEERRAMFAGGDKNLGIVCGSVSGGLVVLDIDDPKLADRMVMMEDASFQAATRIVDTPRGGAHFYAHETDAISRSTVLVPGVADFKGEGGYIVAPPSAVNGKFYKARSNGPIKRVPDGYKWAVEMLTAAGLEVKQTGRQRGRLDVARVLRGVAEGERDESLFWLACELRRDDVPREEAIQIVARAAAACDPPFPLEDALAKVASAYDRYEPSLAGSSAHYDPVIVNMADVEREEVSWLWSRRIPRGRLTGLMGDPGAGKSWVTLAIVAAVTTGAPLPGDIEEREPKRALLLNAEDGLADTVHPRLEDMGANLDNVKVLTAVRGADGQEQFPDLGKHLHALDSEMRQGDYELVVVDPINAFLGRALDTHRDAAIRSVLGPLAQLAETHGVAILFVLHLNKGKRERAMYRAQGSIGYVGQARVMLMAGANPTNPDERALVWVKGNLSPPAEGIGYRITDGRFAWLGETPLTAAHLLSPDSKPDEMSTIGEAKAYLQDRLANGPVDVLDVLNQRPYDLSERTVKRAKKQLGVKSERRGGFAGEGDWVWFLPKDAKVQHTKDLASLEESVSKGKGEGGLLRSADRAHNQENNDEEGGDDA